MTATNVRGDLEAWIANRTICLGAVDGSGASSSFKEYATAPDENFKKLTPDTTGVVLKLRYRLVRTVPAVGTSTLATTASNIHVYLEEQQVPGDCSRYSPFTTAGDHLDDDLTADHPGYKEIVYTDTSNKAPTGAPLRLRFAALGTTTNTPTILTFDAWIHPIRTVS